MQKLSAFRVIKTICCLLLTLLLLGCTSKEEAELETVKKSWSAADVKLPQRSESSKYEQVMLYFDGLLADKAIVKDSKIYVSPESISDYYGLDLTCIIEADTFYLQGMGLQMTGEIDKEYMIANNRYLYTPNGYLVDNDTLYLPEHAIEKVFGIKLTAYGEPMQLEISSQLPSIIKGGANYYEINFNTEALFWLPRIIYAETRDQPMAGLIGVGNVVCNRVNHELFPDTVFEVIFDNEYAVQFTPAATGAVMGEPDERSVVAAYLCLEGYNTVGESLYFVNPDKGKSRWFEEKLQFVCSIGDHDFYAG